MKTGRAFGHYDVHLSSNPSSCETTHNNDERDEQENANQERYRSTRSFVRPFLAEHVDQNPTAEKRHDNRQGTLVEDAERACGPAHERCKASSQRT